MAWCHLEEIRSQVEAASTECQVRINKVDVLGGCCRGTAEIVHCKIDGLVPSTEKGITIKS